MATETEGGAGTPVGAGLRYASKVVEVWIFYQLMQPGFICAL